MKYVYFITCEWDIGQDHEVYASEAAARKSISDNVHINEILQNDDCTLEDLFGDGLVGIERVRVVE